MNLKKITIILEICTGFIIFISYILEIIQSINNYIFKEKKTKKTVIENLLYEIFSFQIYNNLNKYLHSKNEDSKYTNYMSFTTIDYKLNSYYDCLGITDDELNEKICQNQRINNYTCCRAECCSRTLDNNIICQDYIFNIDNIYKRDGVIFNEEELFEDPKIRFCSYYSLNDENIDQDIITNKILYQFKYNYIDLFLNSNETSDFCIGKKYSNCNQNRQICGVIDTYNNYLFLKNKTLCPINKFIGNGAYINVEDINDNYDFDRHLIIHNILSEIKPSYCEFSIAFGLYNEKNVNLKDINNIINIEKYSDIYTSQDVSLYLKDIKDDINYNTDKRNPNAIFNLYSRNYIGFDTVEDLKNFIKNFDKDNPFNNNLYKLCNKILPSIESIIIGLILMILSIIYIILLFLSLLNKYEKIQHKMFTFYIIKQIIVFLTFWEELGIYLWIENNFKKIDINMDKNYKEIIELYNKRRFQLLFLLSIIFIGLAIVISIIGFILTIILKLNYYNKNIINYNDNLVINNENINNENNNNVNNNNLIKFENINNDNSNCETIVNNNRDKNSINNKNSKSDNLKNSGKNNPNRSNYINNNEDEKDSDRRNLKTLPKTDFNQNEEQSNMAKVEKIILEENKENKKNKKK